MGSVAVRSIRGTVDGPKILFSVHGEFRTHGIRWLVRVERHFNTAKNPRSVSQIADTFSLAVDCDCSHPTCCFREADISTRTSKKTMARSSN